MAYDVILRKTTHVFNNFNELDGILSNKDVAYYHFNKEVAL